MIEDKITWKVEDRIICVSNTYKYTMTNTSIYECKLTIGKIYKVVALYLYTQYVIVINDVGCWSKYEKNLFRIPYETICDYIGIE